MRSKRHLLSLLDQALEADKFLTGAIFGSCLRCDTFTWGEGVSLGLQMKFETKSDRCVVAYIERKGRASIAVRAIHDRDGWRIDQAVAIGCAWWPWEAINAICYENLEAAKVAIEEAAKVAIETNAGMLGLSR